MIHDTKPTKSTNLFLRYLHYNITLNITTCFGPQGIIIRESNQSNAAWKQISHLYTVDAVYTSQTVQMQSLACTVIV